MQDQDKWPPSNRRDNTASAPQWEEVKRLAPLEKIREQEGGSSDAAPEAVRETGAEQAVRDLRGWAERYEAEAHAALHVVFPEWVTPPSGVV